MSVGPYREPPTWEDTKYKSIKVSLFHQLSLHAIEGLKVKVYYEDKQGNTLPKRYFNVACSFLKSFALFVTLIVINILQI